MYYNVVPLACDDENLSAISKLRLLAWTTREAKMASYADAMIDKHDQTAFHFGIQKDGALVAAARVNIAICKSDVPDGRTFFVAISQLRGWPIAVFSRLVVHPLLGGKGIPRLLRQPREAVAIEHDCSRILLWSRKKMRPHASFLEEGYVEIATAQGHHIPEINDIIQSEEVAIMAKYLK